MPTLPDIAIELLAGVLQTPAGSRARGAAVKAAAARVGVTPKAFRGWVRSYERAGEAGIRLPEGRQRRERSDRGRSRVIISKRYDVAISAAFGRGMLESIAAELTTQLKQIWNSATGKAGRRHVQIAAMTWLFHRTKHLDMGLTDGELKHLCKVPIPKVRKHRHYHVAHIMRTDAPTWMANYQPRALCSREGLWFGAIVCIDCTALDIVLHRDDGTECFARVIGFQDLATNTVFFYIVWPEKGKGITQADVAAAFISWCRRWGVPASVLIDNGSEFRKIDVLSDMMKLSARIGYERFKVWVTDTAPDLEKIVRHGLLSAKSAIKRARPHNPQAKPIEGQFGNATRFILSAIEGWVGGDRLTQPTKRQGRRAQHYTGSPDQLQREIEEALAYYDNLEQAGHLAGLSPAAARAAQADAGVKRVDVRIDELIEHWSTEHRCSVRQGRIVIPGLGPYQGDFLHTLLVRTKVLARVPLVGDVARIPVFDEYDDLLGFAEALTRRHILAPENAKSQRDRAAAAREAVKALARESAGFDPAESRRQFVAMHPVPSDLKSAGVIQIDQTAKLTAGARRELPPPAKEYEPSGADLWASKFAPSEAKSAATLKRRST
jgi:hypothetical protein